MIDFFKGGEQSIGAMLNFILVIGFLVGSLIVAKKMGAYGASSAVSWGTSLAKGTGSTMLRVTGGATAGLAAAAGRRSAGQIGLNATENQKLLNRTNEKGVRGFLARRQLAVARGLANASFDARGIGGIGQKTGLGEGKVGGQRQVIEDIKKKEKEYGDSLGIVGDDDPRVLMIKQQQHDAAQLLFGEHVA